MEKIPSDNAYVHWLLLLFAARWINLFSLGLASQSIGRHNNINRCCTYKFPQQTGLTGNLYTRSSDHQNELTLRFFCFPAVQLIYTTGAPMVWDLTLFRRGSKTLIWSNVQQYFLFYMPYLGGVFRKKLIKARAKRAGLICGSDFFFRFFPRNFGK